MNFDFEALAQKAVSELTKAEAEALAYFRSTVSHRERAAAEQPAEAPAEAPAPAPKK